MQKVIWVCASYELFRKKIMQIFFTPEWLTHPDTVQSWTLSNNVELKSSFSNNLTFLDQVCSMYIINQRHSCIHGKEKSNKTHTKVKTCQNNQVNRDGGRVFCCLGTQYMVKQLDQIWILLCRAPLFRDAVHLQKCYIIIKLKKIVCHSLSYKNLSTHLVISSSLGLKTFVALVPPTGSVFYCWRSSLRSLWKNSGKNIFPTKKTIRLSRIIHNL